MPGINPGAAPDAGTAGPVLALPTGTALVLKLGLVGAVFIATRPGAAVGGTAGNAPGAGAAAGTADVVGTAAVVGVVFAVVVAPLSAGDAVVAAVLSLVVRVSVEASDDVASLASDCVVSEADPVSVVSVGLGAAGGAAAGVASPRSVSALYFARSLSAEREATTCFWESGVDV